MELKFPGFVGQSYTLPSLKVETQDCVNLYLEANESGAGPYGEATLVSTPGLAYFGACPSLVWRGLYSASNGKLYGVCGRKIYRIMDGGACVELTASGTPVSLNTYDSNVQMADNGTSVLMCHGSESLTGSLYSINMATDALAVVNVEALDVYKVFSLTFKTGRFIIAGFYGVGGTSQANGRFYFSDANSTTFQALSFYTAETSPDRLNQVISALDYVWLGGEKTIEVWQGTESATSPLIRVPGVLMEIGLVGQTMAKVDNALMWLGLQGGTTKVFYADSATPRKVSNYAIESWLSSNDTTGAYSYSYSDSGHLFWVLTCPNTDTTWVYDVSSGAWHERRSYSALPGEGGVLTRHRVRCYARSFGQHIVGDYQTGTLYMLENGCSTDNGLPIVRQRTSPHVAASNERLFFSKFEVICQVGVGLDGGVFGSDPEMQLQYSDDGGYTWSSWRVATMGKIGEFKARCIYRMLGSGRDRVFRVRVTDPVNVRILGADIEVSGG